MIANVLLLMFGWLITACHSVSRCGVDLARTILAKGNEISSFGHAGVCNVKRRQSESKKR